MVSLLTALIIQENDVVVQPYQDNTNQKWGYVVGHTEDRNFRPLATYSPVYESQALAANMGNEFVAQVRALDLDAERRKILDILGHAAPVVQAISDAARG